LSDSIDLRPFAQLLSDADHAFRNDVSYAVSVANAARAISGKREMWAKRKEEHDSGLQNDED